MNPIVRGIVGVVVGLIAGVSLVMLIQVLGMIIFPLPDRIDPMNPESIRANIHLIPTGALVMVLLGHLVGAIGAALLTVWIAGRADLIYAAAMGGLFLVFGIINLFQIPHPVWFAVIDVLTYPIGAFIGMKLAQMVRKKPIADES